MRIKTTVFVLLTLSATLFADDAPTPEVSNRLEIPQQLQGKQVPSFFVLKPNGQDELYKEDIKEEVKKTGAKRVALSFFATYCVSCREEFAILKANKEELKKQGVLVYLVDVGENIRTLGSKVAEMVKSNAGEDFPYYFDQNATLPKAFGLAKAGENLNLPMMIILDSELQTKNILVGKMGKDFPKVLWEAL